MARTLTQLAGIGVEVLDGVGPARAKGLAELDIATVADLLQHYPRRYLDRTREASIAELRPGEEAMVIGRVRSISSRRTRSRKTMVLAEVADGSGRLKVSFFNQPWRERQLPSGTEVVLFGKAEEFRGRLQMTNPVVDLIGDRTGRIVSVYPQSAKARLNSWDLARMVAEALRRAGTFAEPVPDGVLARFGLVDRTTAFADIHAPDTMAAKDAARRRLVFDELLRVQVRLVQRKVDLEQHARGVAHVVEGPLVDRFRSQLPFVLTGAQERTIAEIAADLASPAPMHRLLQGDVGAGKTLVALLSLLVAVQGGHQGALMAPTEVLAEQHALGIRNLLEGFTVPDEAEGSLFEGADMERSLRVELLTNRTPAAARRRILEGLGDGTVDLAIGTHALIADAVSFSSLGLVVIDEQHRFGVEQRAALRAKTTSGSVPDVLVMTATPIPRTAAMTVYGDLDVSVLDEKPPGRTPITTEWVRDEAGEAAMWEAVRGQVAEGRQVYVVCPLIGESEKLEVASAEETYAELTAPGGALDGLAVGLLHGRLGPADKEQTMDLFRTGSLDVLVSTTVIEVGVDVPNATVMVILDADRFGIAQLHQLRGRVGRGSHRSWCYLRSGEISPDGSARLDALVRSEDGFELAEIDLDLRGEGTIMGERQKGRNDLKLASLRRDREWVERAREVAVELVGDDPTMADHQLLADEVDALLADPDQADFLLKG
ncbi:MAG: ATP-dependent DNA helicase RecG [Acidimicrobiia bacterium]|nr:ATP-dependent DNA helicase RecG [Acidimicrobiia bacterium]